MRMQGYCDDYKRTILKRTSPEVKCLHPTSSRCEMCTLTVSNVIYHKFSHGAAFYTINGKNVNVMLEFFLIQQNSNYHKPTKQLNKVVPVPRQYNNRYNLLLFSAITSYIENIYLFEGEYQIYFIECVENISHFTSP